MRTKTVGAGAVAVTALIGAAGTAWATTGAGGVSGMPAGANRATTEACDTDAL